jgi:ribosome-binding factor A
MLEREIADPRMGFATVTRVETDPDLRHARVWVSIIGGTAERGDTLVALDHAMVFIRRELGTRLRLKRIPDLHVRLDDSIERGTRVLQLLDSIDSGRDVGEPPAGESLPTPSRGAGPVGATPEADERPTVAPADPDPGAGFGAAAAEYAASLAASRAARRDARRPGKPAGRPGSRGGRPDGRPGGGPKGRGPGSDR